MVCSRGSLAATWPSLQCAGHHHCHANMYQPTLSCWSQSGWTYIHRIKIFVKVPTLLQSKTIKSGVSKLKRLFTPGLPDTGMLMVQGILSNLSSAISTPSCFMYSGRKGNIAYRIPAYGLLSESHGVHGGMVITSVSSMTQKESVRCSVTHADYFSNYIFLISNLHYRDTQNKVIEQEHTYDVKSEKSLSMWPMI